MQVANLVKGCFVRLFRLVEARLLAVLRTRAPLFPAAAYHQPGIFIAMADRLSLRPDRETIECN